MWQLTCSWSAEHRARTELAGAVVEVTRGWHLLTRRTPVWVTSAEVPQPAVDAARGVVLPGLNAELAAWDSGQADTADLTLYSRGAAAGDDAPAMSALRITARRTGRSVLTWEPLDLTAAIIDDPALARALLVAAAGAFDVDAATWQRSDLAHRLRTDDVLPGWITYRAGARLPPTGTAILRGALVGPFVPASAFGPQDHLDAAAAWSDMLAS